MTDLKNLIKTLLPLFLLIAGNAFAGEVFQCKAFGLVVPQIPVDEEVLHRMEVTGGAAVTTYDGKPVTLYDVKLHRNPVLLNHVLAHECGHHQLGHNYLHSSPTDEHAADCHSVHLLKEEMSYTDRDFKELFQVITMDSGYNRTLQIQSCTAMGDYDGRQEVARR